MDEPKPENWQLAWDAWKHEHETGRRAHDVHNATSLEMLRATITVGVEAIRTSALINGGALVASIALVGAVYQKNERLADKLSLAVLLFAFGVLCAGASSAYAYICQAAYATAHERAELNWEHPFVARKPGAERMHLVGRIFNWLALLSVVLSYAATIGGAAYIFARFYR